MIMGFFTIFDCFRIIRINRSDRAVIVTHTVSPSLASSALDMKGYGYGGSDNIRYLNHRISGYFGGTFVKRLGTCTIIFSPKIVCF